jgi:hypothetical protein
MVAGSGYFFGGATAADRYRDFRNFSRRVAHPGTNRLIGAFLRTSRGERPQARGQQWLSKEFHDNRCAACGRHFACGGTKWACDRWRTARKWRGDWQSRQHGTTRTRRNPSRRHESLYAVGGSSDGRRTTYCGFTEHAPTHVLVNERRTSQKAGDWPAAAEATKAAAISPLDPVISPGEISGSFALSTLCFLNITHVPQ